MNYRLTEYEEVAGCLKELRIDNESLIASIGPKSVILPTDFKKDLEPLIGQRVSVLRTDIPTKRYIVRVISDEKMHHPIESKSLIPECIASMT